MATATTAAPRPTGKKYVTPSEYHFLISHLEEQMLEYEAFTRKNSGSNKGGIRVLHGDPFNYAKYALEQAWKYLYELKHTDTDKYIQIVSGENGQYFPLRLSTTGYAALNQHTTRQRAEFKVSETINRKANGKAKDLHNSERSVFNWRYKLTSSEVLTHANGATSPGFDLFSEWTGINAAGFPDKKGRCGVIGYINLKYVVGPGRNAANNLQDSEIQTNTPNLENEKDEDFTAITPIKNLKNKKKKELSGKFENEAAEPQQTENQKTYEDIEKPGDQQDAKSGPVSNQSNEQKNVDQPPSSARPPQGRYLAALQLWAFLVSRIYLPMLIAGRVRYNSEKICQKHKFSAETDKTAVVSIEELLKSYSAETLKSAIEKQAEWLQHDEKRWIYTPTTFLKPDLQCGGLVSAIRELLRPGAPETVADIPSESLSETQRIDQLYARIINLGCKNTLRHTFLGWYRKHGIDYLTRVVQEFQAEIHRRRSAGAAIGKEFPQGNSAKFAKMVYYSHETLNESMVQNKADLRKKIRSQVQEACWQEAIREVRQLPGEQLNLIWRQCNEHLGFRLSSAAGLAQDDNAILFAWCYKQFSTGSNN